MNGKIDKNGNLHIERGTLGYVPCECIHSKYVQTGSGDGASYVQGWQDGAKSCGHQCSHFGEPEQTYPRNSMSTDRGEKRAMELAAEIKKEPLTTSHVTIYKLNRKHYLTWHVVGKTHLAICHGKTLMFDNFTDERGTDK